MGIDKVQKAQGLGARRRALWLGVLAAAVLLPCGAQASTAQATQKPFGGLFVVNGSAAAVLLDAQKLAQLPQHTTHTATPWTDGITRFEGPLAIDALKAAGVTLDKGMTVQAEALNGYVIDIPAEDFLRWPVILAFMADGKPLTRRDKGPLWIVYPRNSDKVLQDIKYDHRWAWQLKQITIEATP